MFNARIISNVEMHCEDKMHAFLNFGLKADVTI
jgi:hypothetical protein